MANHLYSKENEVGVYSPLMINNNNNSNNNNPAIIVQLVLVVDRLLGPVLAQGSTATGKARKGGAVRPGKMGMVN